MLVWFQEGKQLIEMFVKLQEITCRHFGRQLDHDTADIQPDSAKRLQKESFSPVWVKECPAVGGKLED